MSNSLQTLIVDALRKRPQNTTYVVTTDGTLISIDLQTIIIHQPNRDQLVASFGDDWKDCSTTFSGDLVHPFFHNDSKWPARTFNLPKRGDTFKIINRTNRLTSKAQTVDFVINSKDLGLTKAWIIYDYIHPDSLCNFTSLSELRRYTTIINNYLELVSSKRSDLVSYDLLLNKTVTPDTAQSQIKSSVSELMDAGFFELTYRGFRGITAKQPLYAILLSKIK